MSEKKNVDSEKLSEGFDETFFEVDGDTKQIAKESGERFGWTEAFLEGLKLIVSKEAKDSRS